MKLTPAEQDKASLWHPFTQMADWCDPGHEPLVLQSGKGAMLRDIHGNEYLDGNSSIWTNIHGHAHPAINAAIEAQLREVAHVSFLGFTHPTAAALAERLIELYPGNHLKKVFFSDNGSTAMEAAIKMAVQYRQQNGEPERTGFLAFENAYHGDTMGATSLGGMRLFHQRFATHQFPVTQVSTMQDLEKFSAAEQITAIVIEPLIQGVNRMHIWPKGMLAELRAWCDRHDVFLIADEVMTGFGRTGTLFACEQENVTPDLVTLAKGLTGGYLPLAATLTSQRIYDGFLGAGDMERPLYYGHSYTANALGCAAALASLDLFESERTLENLAAKITRMRELLAGLQTHPHIGAIRQCGFIAGIDLVAADGSPFDPAARIGKQVCDAARKHGLLTRPILDTLVLMPPLCTTETQLESAVEAVRKGIDQVLRPCQLPA